MAQNHKNSIISYFFWQDFRKTRGKSILLDFFLAGFWKRLGFPEKSFFLLSPKNEKRLTKKKKEFYEKSLFIFSFYLLFLGDFD